MNKTNNTIEYCDYTWNPVKGICPINCDYCYARRIYKRFKLDPTIRFDERECCAPLNIKQPSVIFVGSTIDLMHKSIKKEWIQKILNITPKCPQHIFLFLSKCYQNYIKYQFPLNCWLGITIVEYNYRNPIDFSEIGRSNRKFVNFEPLISETILDSVKDIINSNSIEWIIIGGLTPKPTHKKEWIDKIVKEMKLYKIPVFIKHNAKYPESIKERVIKKNDS